MSDTPVNDAAGKDASPDLLVPQVEGVRRIVYLILAAFFFALGLTGVFLPVLPTTPFLLLTSYYLVRTSPRLNRRLLRSKMFGPILVDWQIHRGVRLHIKLKAIFVVLAAVALAYYLSDGTTVFYISAGLASIGILVIVLLPSVRTP